MIVMMIAITPSLNASSLVLFTRPLSLGFVLHGSRGSASHEQRLYDAHDIRCHPVQSDPGAQPPRDEKGDTGGNCRRQARARGRWASRHRRAGQPGGDRRDERVGPTEIVYPEEPR